MTKGKSRSDSAICTNWVAFPVANSRACCRLRVNRGDDRSCRKSWSQHAQRTETQRVRDRVAIRSSRPGPLICSYGAAACRGSHSSNEGMKECSTQTVTASKHGSTSHNDSTLRAPDVHPAKREESTSGSDVLPKAGRAAERKRSGSFNAMYPYILYCVILLHLCNMT